MSESFTIASILYLSVFRLSIIAVGALSIYLGYKLFIAGVGTAQGGEGAGVEASLGGSTFALKNAAPGTFFALFGVVIIASMLINAPAEIKYNKGSTGSDAQDSTPVLAETLTMRGDNENKDPNKVYDKALAGRLNNYAWDLFEKKETDAALTFAMLANHVHPQQGNIIDTIAEFLFTLGRFEEALQFKQKAILADSSLDSNLKKYQEAVKP
jgi:hypothetical protein